MIDWERRVLLKHYLEQGEPIAWLAKRRRIRRRTIHRPDRRRAAGARPGRRDAWSTSPGRTVVHKLDAYKPVVE